MVACSGRCRPLCVSISLLLLGNFEAANETKEIPGPTFIDRAHKIADTEIEHYIGLTHLLTSPPNAIAVMGHVLLLATENDFTFKTKYLKKQFEYFKYPVSFRASLVQLTNIGWDAFNESHINMASMKHHTSHINDHLKLLVNVMKKDTNDEVQYYRKKILKKIELIADEFSSCLSMSGWVLVNPNNKKTLSIDLRVLAVDDR